MPDDSDFSENALAAELAAYPTAGPALDYAAAQTEIIGELARRTPQGTHPWPEKGNPMLEYLFEFGRREGIAKGPLVWLVVHAWFEGGLAAMAHLKDPR